MPGNTKRARSASPTSSDSPAGRKPKRRHAELKASGYSGKGKRVARPPAPLPLRRSDTYDPYLMALEDVQAIFSRQTNMLIAEARRQTLAAEEMSDNFGRLVHQFTRMADAVAGEEEEEDDKGYPSDDV